MTIETRIIGIFMSGHNNPRHVMIGYNVSIRFSRMDILLFNLIFCHRTIRRLYHAVSDIVVVNPLM